MPATAREKIAFEDVRGELVLLGFLGIIDPAREEAAASVAQCRTAGIRVKIDHRRSRPDGRGHRPAGGVGGTRSGDRYVLGAIALILLLQLLFTYLPIMQRLFRTAALPAGGWLRLIAFTFSIFILVELEKSLFRFRDRRKRMGKR